MVLYNQRLGNNPKDQSNTNKRKEEFIMKYDIIVIKGNWTDRVDTVLYHEGIDKNKITFMNITYSGCLNETTFKIYSRG